MAACIFCKIIKGEIPSFKLFESEKTLAFMDIQPLSKGHALIIPKYHGEKLVDIPDEHLTELLPVAKKIAIASGAKDYNILQNNGKIAHQEVGHVHVHIVSFPGIEEADPALLPGAKRSTVPSGVEKIPKPNETEGLGIGWPTQKLEMDDLKALAEQIKSKV